MYLSNSWRAVRHLLSHPNIANAVAPYLNDETEKISPHITDSGWSSGEIALIKIALSIHHGEKISLDEYLYRLDPRSLRLLQESLAIYLLGDINDK